MGQFILESTNRHQPRSYFRCVGLLPIPKFRVSKYEFKHGANTYFAAPKDTASAYLAQHQQRALLYLNSQLTSEIHSERSLMAVPFFALGKTAWAKLLIYAHANVAIEGRPATKAVAPMYDKEIMLYIARLMAGKIERGAEVE